MRSSYLDYAMSVIVGRALPDVRDGLKPVHRRVLFSMHESGLQPNRPVPQVRERRRRRDGQLPSARRLGDLRRARAPRAGLRDARAAGRRAGQLRLDRQRPGRRHAVHGGAAGQARHGDAPRHRRGHRRLHAQLRRHAAGALGAAVAVPEPAGQRLRRHRRRHGHQHPAAQPGRGDRRHGRLHRQPGHRRRGADEAHQGPRLPDRRLHRRLAGDQGRLRDRPRPGRDPRAGPHRADAAGQGGDRRHRDALPGVQGRRAQRRLGPDQEDRRGRAERPRQGDLRPARRVGQVGHPPGHRAQARRDPEGRAQQPLQAHAAADHLRREHGRAGRRRAAGRSRCAS